MLEPHPIVFAKAGIVIYSHGLFFALGALAAYFLSVYLARKTSLQSDPAWMVVAVFAAGLVGARIGFFMVYPSSYAGLADLMSIWKGGLLSYTGIFSGALAAYVILKNIFPFEWQRWADVLVPATLLGWGIGRVGNFLAGDSYGVISAGWEFTYGRVPIQLFESAVCLVLAAYGSYLLIKKRPQPGKIALATSTAYFIARVLVDVWRDEPAMYLGLKPSVITAAVLGAVLLVLTYRHATLTKTI